MNDPVQMLLAAGAIPASPFGASSRYANVAIARYALPADANGGDNSVAYVLRRFIPQAAAIPVATWHTVRGGERIDHLAAHYLGDVELTWRVADANLAGDFLEITATLGRRVAIPLPPGT
jgi:hypothetical protein